MRKYLLEPREKLLQFPTLEGIGCITLSPFVLTNLSICIKSLKSQGGLGLTRFPSNADLPLILILLLLLLLLVKIPPAT